MSDQGALSLPSIPPPSDPGFADPEHAVVALLKVMSGPYLLCEPKIRGSLQELRTLAPTIWKYRKKPLVSARDASNILPALEVRADPDISGSNPSTNWIDVEDLLRNGITHFELFKNSRNIAHLDEALRSSQLASNLCSAGHPERDAAVHNLAACLSERYEQTGGVADLAESVRLQVGRLANHPPGHPARGDILNQLTMSLHLHYESMGDIADLQDAIVLQQECLQLCPQGHPLRNDSLNNLAIVLSARFKLQGNFDDLEEIIAIQRESLECCQPRDPTRYARLSNLASYLNTRYDWTSDPADLDDAIALGQESLNLWPPEHSSRDRFLQNLSGYLTSRFDIAGNIEDLERSISLKRESLELCPLGHRRRDGVLETLATNLYSRYERTGSVADLDEAITLVRESLDLLPPEHPMRVARLNILSASLAKRFENGGELEALEGAISIQREALELVPQENQERNALLSNLAGYISQRCDRVGDSRGLEEAIALEQESLDLCPRGHPVRYIALNNLSKQISKRCDMTGNLEDLEEAISLQQESLELCPPGYRGRAGVLGNLASHIHQRYRRLSDFQDLEEAITLQRESLDLCPRGHPHRDHSLSTLATCLSDRYDLKNNVEDFVEAISLQRESLELCPRGEPSRATTLYWLADYLLRQIHQIETRRVPGISGPAAPHSKPPRMTIEAFAEPIKLLQEAAHHSLSPTAVRMVAARRWRDLAGRCGHVSVLDAMKTRLNIMDLAVAESTSLEILSDSLSDDKSFDGQGVASEATALAIGSGDLRLAVSLLEQGRSIIYSQLSQYRSAIDDVHRVSPELATRLVDLGAELDALVARGERIDSSSNTRTRPFDDNTSRHYNARTAWIKTVEEIRQLPGLESFLLPPPYGRLQEAASKGPVVIVNINRRRSDAIVVYATGDPALVPLPDASPDAVQAIINGFGERLAECNTRKAIGFLREIWAIIVEPIVAQLLLALVGRPQKPRIWWCPTGLASKLPLHAAGRYVRGKQNLGHLFVSSYTPTLGTLIRARRSRRDNITAKGSTRSILIVGQPETPGENPLPKVVDEVEAIQRKLPHASILLASDAIKEAVLTGLCQNAWVHLACHGHYDTKRPFHSSFSMHDGGITLLELIGRDLPHAELAFLSACHSARASETLPDEALHPAAGMMFAGFKSVIGTMWAFDDGVGSALAERFYQLMVEGKKGYTDAADVLADAMQDIVDEDKHAIPFMQRINVVHYGV